MEFKLNINKGKGVIPTGPEIAKLLKEAAERIEDNIPGEVGEMNSGRILDKDNNPVGKWWFSC